MFFCYFVKLKIVSRDIYGGLGLERLRCKMKSRAFVIFTVFFFAGVTVESASAATLAYWRFEGAAISQQLVDSSGNGLTLDKLGSALPSSGGIANPVPLTNQSNSQKLEGFGVSMMPRAVVPVGSPLLTMNAMTVEAYFNSDTDTTTNHPIVCYEPTGGCPAKFRLMVTENDVVFVVWDSGNNRTFTWLYDSIVAGRDYFIAARYDASTGFATIDLWDLANDTQTSASGGFGEARDLAVPSAGYGMDIGMVGGSAHGGWGWFDGTLDEIRISDEVLTDGELLNHLTPIPSKCENALFLGYRLRGDFNGDCYVDIEDFAEFYTKWLDCVFPGDPACLQPWE